MSAHVIARGISKDLVRIGLMLVLCIGLLSPAQRSFADGPPVKLKVRPKREEAARLLGRFDRLRDQYMQQHRRTWVGSSWVGTVGSAALADGFPLAALQLGMRVRLMGDLGSVYFLHQDEGPPDVLFAALAAAREAVRADPKDAEAYRLLGEAYYRLAYRTSERAARRHFALLDRMRRIQMAAAWSRAIQFRPDTVQAHAQLARLYQEMGYMDLLRKHFRRILECTKAAGPAKEEDDEHFDQRIKELKTNLSQLDKEVANRLDRFEVNSAGRPVREKAFLALRLGLPGKALDVLLDSDASVFGVEGARMELELLLMTGRTKEVGEWLSPDVGEALGPTSSHVLLFHRAAAVGDYDEADKLLRKLFVQLSQPPANERKVGSPRSHLAFLVGRMILDGDRQSESPAEVVLVPLARIQYWKTMPALLEALREQSGLLVLRGLLAMERGRDQEAAKHFRAALDLWRSESAVSRGSGLDFNGRILAQHYLRLVEKTKEKTPAEKK
jgi:tetratricopeptide (TPR) repeat protein